MKKSIIYVLSILFVIFIIVGLYVYFKLEYKHERMVIPTDNNVYKYITDMQLLTMENDGGSNTSQYYIVDLDNKNYTLYEDKYIGFKGYEYKDKKILDGKLSDDDVIELNRLFKMIIIDDSSSKDFTYYVLIDPKENEYHCYNKNLNKQVMKILK